MCYLLPHVEETPDSEESNMFLSGFKQIQEKYDEAMVELDHISGEFRARFLSSDEDSSVPEPSPSARRNGPANNNPSSDLACLHVSLETKPFTTQVCPY